MAPRARRGLAPAGAKASVFATPRRFAACYQTDWVSRRLLHADGQFVIIDKPPMLPCQPDNSNAEECAGECAELHLRAELEKRDRAKRRRRARAGAAVRGAAAARRPNCLLAAHRLDTPVSGCLVRARGGARQQFGGWLRARKVTKEYVARSRGPGGGRG